MIVSTFSVPDNDSRKRFFKENFLLANVKPDIIFELLFLIMSNVNSNFLDWDL